MKRSTTFALVLSVAAACGGGSAGDGDDVGDDIGDDDITAPDAGSGGDRPDARGGGSGDGDGGADVTDACGTLRATVRDFKADHDDFENPGERMGDDRGIVTASLGGDGKPVFAHSGGTRTVLGAATFDQWYRDVPGVNMSFEELLPLTETPAGSGVYVFEDNEFFPLDGKGFAGEERSGHNFHFTTEAHATFLYRGGERFTFKGDDDVFVFVNGTLAIDLGGVHGVEEATIDFDARAGELGIQTGRSYAFDVFHAERHLSASNFRIETSIECFTPVD
jgi:fibro-slime domain-containing protein